MVYPINTTDIALAMNLTQSLRQTYSGMQPQRLAATGAYAITACMQQQQQVAKGAFSKHST